MVFELLSVNLYDLMKQNGYRGLSWSLLRLFLKQLLDSLCVLKDAKIIHCDLKPENILLNALTRPDITLIDFGSACFENQTVYSYIQSRFYRSPEVLVGLPYNATIDMWSFGQSNNNHPLSASFTSFDTKHIIDFSRCTSCNVLTSRCFLS